MDQAFKYMYRFSFTGILHDIYTNIPLSVNFAVCKTHLFSSEVAEQPLSKSPPRLSKYKKDCLPHSFLSHY